MYPYLWQNVYEHQLFYTWLCKTSGFPRTLTIYLPSGIYLTVKDVIHGMLRRRLHNGLRDIYIKSENTITSLGANECFYIKEKAQDFFELKLLPGCFVTLPKTLARALGNLRANVGIHRESQISSEKSNFGLYHPNNPLEWLFQKMILRNPQALYN